MSNANRKNSPSTSKSNKANADFYRHQLIEEYAYSLASARGFRDGNEQEDWFAAEREIDAQLSR
jgi:hypothetical protein